MTICLDLNGTLLLIACFQSKSGYNFTIQREAVDALRQI